MAELRRTPLYDLHLAQGAKMVPYAGWEMPVQYPLGVMAEHLHTRAHAGLFDVSHMGQIILRGADAAAVLETLVPADIQGLAPGRQRYGLFTGPEGGILDDLMIANKGDHLLLVVNASRAEHDLAHLQGLQGVTIEPVTDRALLALQGPEAAEVLARLVPEAARMTFMDARDADWQGVTLWLTRSGYTGEDGYEISVPAKDAVRLAEALLAFPEVAMIGLGARDSLRLEAGLPLYGNDMDDATSPARAGLGWSIPKLRRPGGARAGGYPGAEAIGAELAEGARVLRTGLRPQGRAPIREGVELFAGDEGGEAIGKVRSGGFGPSVGGPIAMAELPRGLAPGDVIWAELRGKRLPVEVVALPFFKPNYKR
ncbi:glycine cleavage system aminomethyltransferase GcvT [Paracoccus sulfuroxidans]|uniref:aminomethyltransferase n=1 Tax=Paracoccus sulfuroxidans TaxID=384678 RepID=A0A562NNU2_9RHOB|nr:glycine cleavage system aminomethyltransferase GcvT [Paracoccus sulfuroxidans]TWI33854.1 aminomethyltransferase [Paracoccus sulfuroxidans]